MTRLTNEERALIREIGTYRTYQCDVCMLVKGGNKGMPKRWVSLADGRTLCGDCGDKYLGVERSRERALGEGT